MAALTQKPSLHRTYLEVWLDQNSAQFSVIGSTQSPPCTTKSSAHSRHTKYLRAFTQFSS